MVFPMRLIDTPLGEISDPILVALIDEMRNLRCGQFADVCLGPLLHFLENFFLPGDGKRFVPIRKSELLLQQWLPGSFVLHV
jgi:hypothetical protein